MFQVIRCHPRKLVSNSQLEPFLTLIDRELRFETLQSEARGGGVLPYMGSIGMCRCEGYGFQAVYSRIECINQSVWV